MNLLSIMCHEAYPRANTLAQQASSYNVRKRNFQDHKSLLTVEYFALEAPIRPTQPTGLIGDTDLTVVTDRSDRPLLLSRLTSPV
jgi:hypothetical protein